MPSGAATLSDLLSSVQSLRRRTTSLRSIVSRRSSLRRNDTQDRISTYKPYAVYDQSMAPLIFRDPEAARKLLEIVLESPGGRRSLSRLARTCRVMSGMSLAVLWKELDSLVPLIGLFPSSMLKKARRPGLGVTRAPTEAEWEPVLRYGELVRTIVYDESIGNVHPSIFAVLEQHRPTTYILPNLVQLTWKADSAAGLDRSSMFLHPQLKGLTLHLGTRLPMLQAFLADVTSRTKLESFSFSSLSPLPNSFIDFVAPLNGLRSLTIQSPGAVSAGTGRWIGSLVQLRSLTLDLSGRTMIAVESFFDELRPRSGDSTPSSVGTTDSGVFTADEVDFSDVRKSSLRLTGDSHHKGSFSGLRALILTGDVSAVAVFLKHIPVSTLRTLDLSIQDSPDANDWQDLSQLICDRFGRWLRFLRVSSTRSNEVMRSPGKGQPPRLSLEHFHSLAELQRFEIDLAESVSFLAADIAQLAAACPNIQELKLCPLARFPPTAGAPRLTLDDLAPLMTCLHLHTLAVAVNARRGSVRVLDSREASSQSLLRLHVGHSWVNDSFQVSILLSHLSPFLESLKWFHEPNRPGYIEANARSWERVMETLPHHQRMRRTDRASVAPQIIEKIIQVVREPEPISTAEKAVDASVVSIDQGVLARPQMAVKQVQARPSMQDARVEARPILVSQHVDATVSTIQKQVDATVPAREMSVQTTINQPLDRTPSPLSSPRRVLRLIPLLFGLVYQGWRWALTPITAPCYKIYALLSNMQIMRPTIQPKSPEPTVEVAMKDLQVGA